MKHLYITCLAFVFITTGAFAQVEDFESFGVTEGNPLIQADNGIAIEGNNLILYNNYNADWASWDGFVISADSDVTTPGFGNQYSCIAGTGMGGSQSYAMCYASPVPSIETIEEGSVIKSITINNSTYAYFSMLDGDSFAKKFGGVTGDDPDFFLMTIKGYKNGELLPDTLNHYLADYRFEDNSQDYIQTEWASLDIEGTIGNAESLSFHLSSSDEGEFGINTPAYFCMDDVSISVAGNTAEISTSLDIKVGPNPTTDNITLTAQQKFEAVTLYDAQGNVRYRSSADRSTQTIDLSEYSSGIYTILVTYEGTDYLQQIVKL